MKRLIISTVFLAHAAVSAAATASDVDHLEPDVLPFGTGGTCDERIAPASLLGEAKRHVQMIVSPPFERPYVVYVARLKEDPLVHSADAELFVFAKRATESLLTAETSKAPIDEKTLAALEDLWAAALVDASPTPRGSRMILDGTDYHFADYSERYGWRTGHTEGPSPGPKVRELVSVGELLFEYASAARAERDARAKTIRERARAARILIVGDGPPADKRGRLLLRSEPPGAAVSIDGKPTPLVTPGHVDLEDGSVHTIGFKLDGYRDAQRTDVPVYPGVERAVRVELVPLMVRIQLETTPSAAAVQIDGVEVCDTTPCEIARRPEDGYPVIVVTKPGCESYRTTVVLEPLASMRYGVRLQCK